LGVVITLYLDIVMTRYPEVERTNPHFKLAKKKNAHEDYIMCTTHATEGDVTHR